MEEGTVALSRKGPRLLRIAQEAGRVGRTGRGQRRSNEATTKQPGGPAVQGAGREGLHGQRWWGLAATNSPLPSGVSRTRMLRWSLGRVWF